MPKPENAGAALKRTIVEALPPGVELDEREQALLEQAARQADDIAALERDIAERGHIVTTAKGEQKLNPSVMEARQGRAALGRLLGGIDLPDSSTFTELRASKAARARWAGREAS